MSLLRRWSNRLGISGGLVFIMFWIFVHSSIDFDAVSRGVYIEFALTWGAVSVSAIVAVLAAVGGRKWWLLALLGPIAGAMLLLSAGA